MLKLSVVTPEVGEYEEEIAIDYDGDSMEIAFNPDFLVDILKHLDTESTQVVLKDAMSPGILKPFVDDGEDKYVNVVMPIRIS
jgi:DNA polymerase-3 subunit beta